MSSHASPDLRWRRATAGVLAICLLNACVVWKPAAASVVAKGPSTVRVNRTVVVSWPTVSHDSLLGRRDGIPVAFALADVKSLETRHVSAMRTTALILGLAVGTLVIAFLASDHGALFGPGTGPVITLRSP